MIYNTILFDMDGTLNESGEGIVRSAAYACEKKGVPVPPEDVLRKFIGPPLAWSFENFCGMSREEALHAVSVYRERYSTVGWKENMVYPGMAQLLRQLKKQGAYVAIASGKPEVFVKRIIEFFGLTDCFDRIIGITTEDHDADKHDLIRRALPEAWDVKTTCMIGDRRFDVEAANDMGIASIGVTYGYGSREELEEAGAGSIVDSVRELYALLLPGIPFPRGKFITFEGSDGCGKSTQLKLLNEYLTARGYETRVSREPGGCAISERIREMLLDISNMGMTGECEALLFAAARAQHIHDTILPALEDGKIVLCDRYLDSSVAYQAYGRELGEDFVRQINRAAMQLPPDRTLLFRGDRAVIAQRLKGRTGDHPDRIESEKESFVERLNDAFDRTAKQESDRVHAIDSARSIEEIFADVRADIADLLV